MQIFLCIVSVLFGVLSAIAAIRSAAISQIWDKKTSFPAWVMLAGALLLLAAVVCNSIGRQFDFVVALLGCTAICAAALANGIKSEQLHVPHHVIRIVLSAALLVGFAVL